MNSVTGENMARRYPMSFALRYEVADPELGRTGAGETVWMSGKEVAFLSKGLAAVGDKVKLHIEWPVLLEGEVPLQLVATVEILQRSGPLSVAKMTKYEFRTRGLQASSMGVRQLLQIPVWEPRPAYQLPENRMFGIAPRRPAAAVSAAGG